MNVMSALRGQKGHRAHASLNTENQLSDKDFSAV